jgi:hypothetical protein
MVRIQLGCRHAHFAYSKPALPKPTAPIHSHRQASANIPRVMAVGIRCIIRANRVFRKPKPSLKTSSANRLRKIAKAIPNARGVQTKILLE